MKIGDLIQDIYDIIDDDGYLYEYIRSRGISNIIYIDNTRPYHYNNYDKEIFILYSDIFRELKGSK